MKHSMRQELDDLFSMFHDFEIINLTFANNILDLKIRIPWGELWDDLDFQISVKLSGCEYIHCDYAEVINTSDNLAKKWAERNSIDKSTNDPKTISNLGLEVQRHKFYAPNKYIFFCNSSKNNYAGGQFNFTTDNYIIYDKAKSQIELDQMSTWCTKWWERIEKNK